MPSGAPGRPIHQCNRGKRHEQLWSGSWQCVTPCSQVSKNTLRKAKDLVVRCEREGDISKIYGLHRGQRLDPMARGLHRDDYDDYDDDDGPSYYGPPTGVSMPGRPRVSEPTVPADDPMAPTVPIRNGQPSLTSQELWDAQVRQIMLEARNREQIDRATVRAADAIAPRPPPDGVQQAQSETIAHQLRTLPSARSVVTDRRPEPPEEIDMGPVFSPPSTLRPGPVLEGPSPEAPAATLPARRRNARRRTLTTTEPQKQRRPQDPRVREATHEQKVRAAETVARRSTTYKVSESDPTKVRCRLCGATQDPGPRQGKIPAGDLNKHFSSKKHKDAWRRALESGQVTQDDYRYYHKDV
jgi:hypothetical protein